MEAIAFPQCLNLVLQTPPTPNKFKHGINNFSATLLPHDLNELKSLHSVKEMHAQIVKMSEKWVSSERTQSLISNYLEFGDFQSAATVFFLGFQKNYLYLDSFLEELKGFGGDPFEILEVFSELHKKGVEFNSSNITLVMKICSSLMELWFGLEIHALLIKRGLDFDVYIKCALMNFYGVCSDIKSANQVFYETPNHESLLWKEAILMNLKSEKWVQVLQLFSVMQYSFVKTNIFTIHNVLQTCAKLGALDEGKQIHGYVIRNALESNILICNSLINMYMKNNDPVLARTVFDLMENRNLSSWNSIISGYTILGYLHEALNLFQDMQIYNVKPDIVTWNCLLSGHLLSELYFEVLSILRKMQYAGYKPNSVSIISVLQAICKLGFLKFGKEIHCYVLRNGFESNLHVVTSLLDMYVKNNDLIQAKTVFDNMKNRNIFAWNTLISGYVSVGRFEEVRSFLDLMGMGGIKPDLITYNIMVSGYSSLGCIKEALDILIKMKTSGLAPNVVSWTALISGCSQNGYHEDAFRYSIEMQTEGIKPNSSTLSSLLRSCAGLSLLQKGKEIHCHSIRNGLVEDVFMTTALIDMYSKSGSYKNAYDVFQNAKKKTLASWNSMIGGLAMYSFANEAISLFHKMPDENIQPDSITFTAVLSSCKNSGLIDQGWKYFDLMKREYNIIPKIEHYTCMVDLLGRAGYIDEAWDIIQTMPMQPDVTVWGSFLGSCRVHENLNLGKIAARKLFELEPQNPANYISLMNLYAVLNKWEDVDRIRTLMRARGLKNGHIWSWIQIKQTVHVFSARGKPHQDEGEIHFELYQLISEMKNLGYVPAIDCVYHNIDAMEKEKILLGHSEKLAITYGLIKTKGSAAPIRVIKNTRICSDCHTVAKYISLLRNRVILLKDGLRFHHFSNGKCSCNDFW